SALASNTKVSPDKDVKDTGRILGRADEEKEEREKALETPAAKREKPTKDPKADLKIEKDGDLFLKMDVAPPAVRKNISERLRAERERLFNAHPPRARESGPDPLTT